MGKYFDPDNLVGILTAVKLSGLTKDGLRYYLTGGGEPAFPAPILKLDGTVYYDRGQIAEWKKTVKQKKQKRGRPRKSAEPRASQNS
jgi:hypothetical protein